MACRLHCSKVHLTYKTHLPVDDYFAWLPSKGNYKMISFVHEVGDADEDCPTPYEHTHVFLWHKKTFDTTDPIYFDFNGVHPNIKNERSIKWAHAIVSRYHLGHKTKAGGKKYYKEPVLLQQEGVQEWKMDEDSWDIAENAATIEDACLELGIGCKSTMVRAKSNKRGFDEMEDGVTKDMFKPIEWDKTKVLILRGPSGCGKTNWAIAQFEKVFKIETIGELKNLPPDTQCILFDGVNLSSMKDKSYLKNITDYKQPRTIKARYRDIRIPAGICKIFLCNIGEHPFGDLDKKFPPDCAAAIKRRFVLKDVGPNDLKLTR